MYEEDLVHRMPGDASTLSPIEAQFPVAQQWVAAERQQSPSQEERIADSQQAFPSPESHSFTRVVVAELKPEVLQQITDIDRYEQVCRDLAHLYHYYLHGQYGNIASDSRQTEAAALPAAAAKRGKRKSRSPPGDPQQLAHKSGMLPSGQAIPSIVIEHHVEGSIPQIWEANLADVNDDTESLYLQAQQAQLPFTLTVPDHGTVHGVMWYFPFQNDQETLPLGHHPMMQAAAPSHLTQLTQAEAAHQAAMTQQTQRPTGTQLAFAGQGL